MPDFGRILSEIIVHRSTQNPGEQQDLKAESSTGLSTRVLKQDGGHSERQAGQSKAHNAQEKNKRCCGHVIV